MSFDNAKEHGLNRVPHFGGDHMGGTNYVA